MIAVIDYGMGNLRSVEKALEVAGGKIRVVSDRKGIEGCDKLVFPGVGSFGDAMKELKARRLIDPIKDAIKSGKPFLGLCLGLQLLFKKSEEAPGVRGLGILEGEVKRFRPGALKVPHMGWNNIEIRGQMPENRILDKISNNSYMYFVHSYYVKPEDKGVVLTTTDYGIKFVSAVARNNIYGLQFHPEKSQVVGLKILKNFVRL
jgi:glutamine amidotransferase